MQLSTAINKAEINEEFAKDICDFFAGRRSGHVGTWRYSEPLFEGDKVNGMYHWAEFVKKARSGSAYYAVNDELNVIHKTIPSIHSIIPSNITVVDLGPGSKEAVLEKVGPFIKTGWVSAYVGVDIVKECLERTEKIIADEFPKISYFGINRNFYKHRLSIPVKGTPVLLMFGQTLFNLPIDPLDKTMPNQILFDRLAHFRNHLPNYGYLVITQDCNQNPQSLYDAYMTEADFDLNLLYRIKRDLPVSSSYTPENFAFEPCWISKTNAASHTYICKNDMSFTIADESFSLKEGQRLYMHNTYKFSSAHFLKIAKKAHFEPIYTETSDSGRVTLHVLKAI